MVKPINQKEADKIMQRLELEEKMILAYNFGKHGKTEIEFKAQLKEWLDKKFPDLEFTK
jgi:hypothetical protein